MDQSKELLMRVKDLSEQAMRRGSYTYTGFLSPAELSDIFSAGRELFSTPTVLWGEGSGSERRIIAFGSEAYFGYPPCYPVHTVSISPVSGKFSEELSHRDYLGALMNLGIKRSLLGDIVIRGKYAWLYCLDTISEYICDSLTTVRHTTVSCAVVSGDIPELAPIYEELRLNVPSERIDAITAAFIGKSRSSISELFASGRVFVNSREVTDASKPLREGDILSVRGFGKAIYDGISGTSKKGRLYAALRKFV